MKNRSRRESAAWCSEVTYVAAGIRSGAEMIVASSLPIQQRVASLHDVGEKEAAREHHGSVACSLATIGRMSGSSMEEGSSNYSETHFHICWVGEDSGEEEREVNDVSRGETENRIRDNRWSGNSTGMIKSAYCEKGLWRYGSVQHQVDMAIEKESTLRRGREGAGRRRSTDSGVRRCDCSHEGILRTGVSNKSTRRIAGADGAVRWDSAVYHTKHYHSAGDRRSSRDQKKSGAGGRGEQKEWQRPGQSEYKREDRGLTQFSWLSSALLKIVVVLPRCIVALRRRFGQHDCGPLRAGGGHGAAYAEASVERPGQVEKSSRLPANGEDRQQSEEHSRQEKRTADEVRRELDCTRGKTAEDEKAQPAEKSRALFDCCVPSVAAPASTPLRLSRYVLLSVYTLQAFLTGCVYFGWPALSSMLYRSGAYAWLCTPSELARGGGNNRSSEDADAAAAGSRPYFCNAQDAAVAPLFTVCHVSECVTCVIAGYLTDRCSPKGVCIFGQSLHVVGWTLLACSSVHFPAYVPAMIFIGCGSATAYLPLLRVALLFPRSKATTIAVLGAANTGSFAMPCILEAIWRQTGTGTNAAAAPIEGALPGGSAGGEGWTFTHICLLYLGIGPLCCIVLAAFFLPTRRFSVVVQCENAGQGKRHRDEKVADQEQRRITSATDAVRISALSTATGADALDSSTETDVEEEDSNTSSVTPTWKVWNLCCDSSRKQPCIHVQRRKPCRTRDFFSTLHRHREREETCDRWRLYRWRGTRRDERRTQLQPLATTGELLHDEVEEVVEQRASEACCEGTPCRVTVSKDRGIHRKGRDSRSNDCIGEIVEGDIQRSHEGKTHGRRRLYCVCSIDSFVNKNSPEGQHKIERQECTRSAGGEKQDGAATPRIKNGALGLRLSSRETWEEGDVHKRGHASRDSSVATFRTAKPLSLDAFGKEDVSPKPTRLQVDSLTCKKSEYAAAAKKDEAADQIRINSVSREVLPGPSLAASPPLPFPVALRQAPRSLQQEEATCSTSQAGKRQERCAERAGVKVVPGTEEPLRSGGRPCRSAPDKDIQTGKYNRREGAETVCCKRIRSARASRRMGRRQGLRVEKYVTERCEEEEGRRPPWLVRWQCTARGFRTSPAVGRQLALREKEVGNDDAAEGTEEQSNGTAGRRRHTHGDNLDHSPETEEQSKRTVGRRCHAHGDSLYHGPQGDTAEHFRLHHADSKDISCPCAVVYLTGQTSAPGVCTAAARASSSVGRQKVSPTESAAAPHTTSGADRFSSAGTVASSEYCAVPLRCVQKVPDNRGRTTVAQAILAATTEGGGSATGEPKSVTATSEEAVGATTACGAASDDTPEAQTAIARTPLVSEAIPTACDAGIPAPCGCRACAECDTDGTPRVATTAFATSSSEKATFPTTPELRQACCVFAYAAVASDASVGSALPCVESTKKKATFVSQFMSVHFASLVCYSGIVSIAISFMQSSSSRLFSASVLAFMDWALPFSFIPCILLGRLIDVFGPFPVLLFMNSMGLLSYLCAALTPLHGVHYLSVLAFCVYVSLDCEQIYCYVEYTFRPEHFGRLTGLLMAIDGVMSLVSIPLYDHLTVRNLGGNPLPVALGISGMLGVAYFLLAGLWLHRRKYPDPFGLLDNNYEGNGFGTRKAKQPEEEAAEVRVSETSREDGDRNDGSTSQTVTTRCSGCSRS